MVINIIGDCDKRPVLYTLMKVCQALGDVLLVTNSSRLIRLSDTGESYGHCQNTMIAVTCDSIDEFWEQFTYDVTDFDFIIVDNIIDAEADVTLYVRGLTQSINERDNLEYLEEYLEIELYKGKLVDATTLLRCEEFEALRDFCVISNKISEKVAALFAPVVHIEAKRLYALATTPTSTHLSSVPTIKKSKLQLFGKR